MQKYATRGQDDIDGNVFASRYAGKHGRGQTCDLAGYVAFGNISGGFVLGRVHNGRMKGKSTGSRQKRSVVTAEEQALFLEAMGDVVPLDSRDRVHVPPPPPSPVRVVELPPETKLI